MGNLCIFHTLKMPTYSISSTWLPFLCNLSVTGCFFYPEALRLVVESAKPDVSVLSLCEKGDAFIMAETGKVFKKEKEMKKGESNIYMSNIFWGELFWAL